MIFGTWATSAQADLSLTSLSQSATEFQRGQPPRTQLLCRSHKLSPLRELVCIIEVISSLASSKLIAKFPLNCFVGPTYLQIEAYVFSVEVPKIVWFGDHNISSFCMHTFNQGKGLLRSTPIFLWFLCPWSFEIENLDALNAIFLLVIEMIFHWTAILVVWFDVFGAFWILLFSHVPSLLVKSESWTNSVSCYWIENWLVQLTEINYHRPNSCIPRKLCNWKSIVKLMLFVWCICWAPLTWNKLLIDCFILLFPVQWQSKGWAWCDCMPCCSIFSTVWFISDSCFQGQRRSWNCSSLGRLCNSPSFSPYREDEQEWGFIFWDRSGGFCSSWFDI